MAKIQVPEGMLKAAIVAYNIKTGELGYKYVIDRFVMEATLEAALQHLAQHPIVPTAEQAQAMKDDYYPPSGEQRYSCSPGDWKRGAVEWQRRMFLAEPEVPEEVKDLLSPTCQNLWEPSKKEYDAAVLEAFRRGRSKG